MVMAMGITMAATCCSMGMGTGTGAGLCWLLLHAGARLDCGVFYLGCLSLYTVCHAACQRHAWLRLVSRPI